MKRRALGALTLLAALATAGLPSSAAPQVTVRSVTISGSLFKIALSDGRVLPQEELPGLELGLGDGSGRQRRIRIDSIEPDPKDATGTTILYGLSEQEPSGGWRNLCLADPDGKKLGFPLQGQFTGDGRYIAGEGRLLITCTGGAEGKCIRFGYHPWGRGPDGTPLAAAYNACVRLVRADYAGDGKGTTRNGQPIDIYDNFGVQAPAYDKSQDFEAGFSETGAVCVRHVRVRDNASLAELAATPRLAGQTGDICTEEYARAQGAILFVRSPP